MNIGVIACMIVAAIFLVMAIVFTLMKDKGAMLIGGFNTLPKDEYERYDKKRMCADQRNMLLLWAVIFLAGAMLSYFISSYVAIVAFGVWLILFFKEVHFDATKAFEKYKIK